jgi:hypothetical protein
MICGSDFESMIYGSVLDPHVTDSMLMSENLNAVPTLDQVAPAPLGLLCFRARQTEAHGESEQLYVSPAK